MDGHNYDIRRSALERLAALAVSSSVHDDLDRLVAASRRPKPQQNGFFDGVVKGLAPTSRLPMVRI
jgi:hypothetical protein